MDLFSTLRGAAVMAFVAVGLLAVAASAAIAGPTVLCVKASANGAVKGPTTVGGSTCKAGYSKITLPSTEEQEVLNNVMPHIKYQASGVGGKPTIQFSGVNVQVVNGEGKTASVNGEGNLVVGYDENKEGKHAQTGSHDLLLGEEQTFTSYGGIVAGLESTVSGPNASVSGGVGNRASGEQSSVSGGQGNGASGKDAWVGGGFANTASNLWTTVGGGLFNTASAERASISGGESNTASGLDAWVTGGESNIANGIAASISGGYKNKAEGAFSSIFGSKELTAKNSYEAIP